MQCGVAAISCSSQNHGRGASRSQGWGREKECGSSATHHTRPSEEAISKKGYRILSHGVTGDSSTISPWVLPSYLDGWNGKWRDTGTEVNPDLPITSYYLKTDILGRYFLSGNFFKGLHTYRYYVIIIFKYVHNNVSYRSNLKLRL